MNNRIIPIVIVIIVAVAVVALLANNNRETAPQTSQPTTQQTIEATTQGTEPPTVESTTQATIEPTVAPTAAPASATSAPTVAAQPFTLINLNTATSEQLMTIPNMSNRMVREFFEYRPYVSIQQFRREIGKYVDEAQVAAYEAYVYVPINVDEADAETLKQIPGVDDAVASTLIAARPYASNDAFLQKLAESLSAEQVAFARNYLE